MYQPGFALFNLALIGAAAVVGLWMFFRSNPDTAGIRGSQLLSARVRAWYFSNLVPFEKLFVRYHVRPAMLTGAQLVVSVVSALAYASGLIYTAGFLVLATGTLDILDGHVARLMNNETRRGAFLDSVIDRYAEFFGYLGLIVFFAAGWPVWAALLAILGGMMVSYTRARAEGLGVTCDVGLLQRPERFVLLGFGSIASSIAVQIVGGNHELLAATIGVLAVMTNITALQRLIHISRRLDEVANG